jgi:flavin reductase (DIM6/NTAB) family NADH-FMN oxidoreductase RutF
VGDSPLLPAAGGLARANRVLDPAHLAARDRYQLMTSLVGPRPIGWLSTWGPEGVPNLAPFSYFAALSVAPMLIGVSIGMRRDEPKDSLVNIRARGAFCVNIVTEDLLEPMNESSANVAPEVDEFELAGLARAVSDRVDAPFVAEAAAVLECALQQEVDLGTPNALLIAEVVGVRLDERLPFEDGTMIVDPGALRLVGRLGGSSYAIASDIRSVPRPAAD